MKVQTAGRTAELWPISPDRIAPIPSKERGKLLSGFATIEEDGVLRRKASVEFTPETIIHFKLLDPANPINGIAPLRAASRAVDTDNSQVNWNKAGMDNRGVFDGIFSFAETLMPEQAVTIAQLIREKFSGGSNARKPLVLGSNAKYQRLSISPAEMDFIDSRKFNREEIMSIFGVPLQLVGSEESATYNNFSESLRIFWMTTIVPLLDDMADTLNLSLSSELSEGLRVGYDVSSVEAMRESEDTKVDVVKKYWDMGVPLSVLNEKMNLGLDAFDEWDKPFSGSKAPAQQTQAGRANHWQLRETRNFPSEKRSRDKLAEGPVNDAFLDLLKQQRKDVFEAMDLGPVSDETIQALIASDRDKWMGVMNRAATAVALDAADGVVVSSDGRALLEMTRRGGEYREITAGIESLIEEYLAVEAWMLTDLSNIEETTVSRVIEQLRNGISEGMTTQQIKQAIDDVGVFGPSRSLMLARTLSGTAASIGQFAGAVEAGATEKEWATSGREVRDIHIARAGERVPILDRFSNQGYGAPRYPLDPVLEPADRVNCVCAMLFH
ncbi:phage portal protein, partial [bacterium]|nr:phage portal protein [bacterium]